MINYFDEIKKIKVHKRGKVVSLHKPLLLLLTISEITRGHRNNFLFDDIEDLLSQLLSKYGLKNSAKTSPQYPFVYLASNRNLWQCSIDKRDLRNPDAASRKEVLGATGSFTNQFHSFIKTGNNAEQVVQYLLNEYWPKSYHEDILEDVGLTLDLNTGKFDNHNIDNQRGRKFVIDVLDAYERKCAICFQSIRLGDFLIGLDACHVKPLQHYGVDNVVNGIALCKLHHWALDRGAISISNDYRVLVSPKMNGNKLEDFFTRFDQMEIFIPRNKSNLLDTKNTEYHYKYIFIK